MGHSITKDNIIHYLRRDNRKIRALREELKKIENDIYEELEKRQVNRIEDTGKETLNLDEQDVLANDNDHQQTMGKQLFTMEEFIEITKANPQWAQKLAANNLVAM